MAHDFVNFPELTNSQMNFYYFESPHKQIFEDFTATCVKVHDGDTITVRWSERNFDFPVRMSNVSARELTETPERNTSSQMTMDGKSAKSWLESKILGEDITIKINPNNRVEKFGRLLGQIIYSGMDIGEEEIILGVASSWSQRNDGNFNNPIKEIKWQ